jgi:hypothetical protein
VKAGIGRLITEDETAREGLWDGGLLAKKFFQAFAEIDEEAV